MHWAITLCCIQCVPLGRRIRQTCKTRRVCSSINKTIKYDVLHGFQTGPNPDCVALLLTIPNTDVFQETIWIKAPSTISTPRTL